MIITSGFIVLTALAVPAIRPPPPTGITIASTSGTWSRISRPMVPWPARMLGWSYPFTYCIPFFRPIFRASTRASPISAPWMTTFAPYRLQFSTFMMGATTGITTVTGMPIRPPWYATAWAWFPAEAAITPALFSLSESLDKVYLAPRSLKLPVYCMYSFLKKRSIPSSAFIWLRSQEVFRTPSLMMYAAAAMSSNLMILGSSGSHQPSLISSSSKPVEDTSSLTRPTFNVSILGEFASYYFQNQRQKAEFQGFQLVVLFGS